MPGGVQTNAKAPEIWGGEPPPGFASRASGGRVWDLDGNEWIDFPMALGSVLLGHAEPAVTEAIRRQLCGGISFTLMHPLEVTVAERIAAMCPGVDTVRFTKSGSEATAAAVRLARARTGRDKLVVCGYHGWHDWCAGAQGPQPGVPEIVGRLAVPVPYGDLAVLERLLAAQDVAAVVVDPIATGRPSVNFLHGVVDLCQRAGTVSIFDEVIAGFRIALGGAREKYGVMPDVSCYGKALGNGMPIAAVAGSRAIMGEYLRTAVSGTYAGETLSLAAANAVLDHLEGGTVLTAIAGLGADLKRGLADVVARYGLTARISVRGEDCRPTVIFSEERDKAIFQRSMVERRILFNGTFNLCARHTEADITAAVDAAERASRILAGQETSDG
jgi:glutamate-1-semialdehyde aminotransferase